MLHASIFNRLLVILTFIPELATSSTLPDKREAGLDKFSILFSSPWIPPKIFFLDKCKLFA